MKPIFESKDTEYEKSKRELAPIEYNLNTGKETKNFSTIKSLVLKSHTSEIKNFINDRVKEISELAITIDGVTFIVWTDSINGEDLNKKLNNKILTGISNVRNANHRRG